MSADFNISSELINDALLLKTDGYLNNVGGEKIAKEVLKHKDSGINKIILDLEKSKVVNSIGISYIIELIEELNQSNGKLFFLNLDPTIEKTFSIMGLFQFAHKIDSIDSTLAD